MQNINLAPRLITRRLCSLENNLSLRNRLELLNPHPFTSSSSKSFSVSSVTLVKTSSAFQAAQTPRMKQVEVDELDVQKQLGKINMDFVRKAEKRNKERATMHRFFRRKDWIIAGFCFSLVIGIYSYTIFAIQQEKFLDDFEMPEEIDRTKSDNKL